MPYLSKCESHLQQLISAEADICGAMWPSVIDVRTHHYPEGEHVPKRVYRLIGAPRGSTLYWDQPSIVAAHAVSELSGDTHYREAANRYIDAFLGTCVAENGMFLWGNHIYYDVFEKKNILFHGGPHELRPITPAWEIFWTHAPEKTDTYIRTMADRHVYDPETGAFNRHDTGEKGHAFLEAGGILCESLAWLYSKTQDNDLLEKARKIACYSYSHRNPATGLVPNEPDVGRWDSKVCTSEIGLWAQCLLRAGAYTGDDEFIDMAGSAISAFKRFALSTDSMTMAGQVDVKTGKPVIPEKAGYWPDQYANPWNTNQWPTHDYPMAVAEACLTLHELTGKEQYRQAVERLARMLMDSSPGNTGTNAYAESYGRGIHFLARTGLQLDNQTYLDDASTLATEACNQFWENGMFKGYSNGHVYESVDGVGFLLLALLFSESPTTTAQFMNCF